MTFAPTFANFPIFFGPAGQNIGLTQDASRAIVALNSTARDMAQVFLNTSDIENIEIDALAGADEIVINNQADAASTAGDFIQKGTDLSQHCAGRP